MIFWQISSHHAHNGFGGRGGMTPVAPALSCRFLYSRTCRRTYRVGTLYFSAQYFVLKPCELFVSIIFWHTESSHAVFGLHVCRLFRAAVECWPWGGWVPELCKQLCVRIWSVVGMMMKRLIGGKCDETAYVKKWMSKTLGMDKRFPDLQNFDRRLIAVNPSDASFHLTQSSEIRTRWLEVWHN